MKQSAGFYWTLFRSTFSLSAFTVGGGFVIVPLMKKQFVDKLHWIDEDEMLDIAAISQSAPGPIAVNAAILVGYRLSGLVGALVSILGTILPPLLLLSVISVFYQAFRENVYFSGLMTGMRAGVAAVIVDVVMKMSLDVVRGKDPVAIVSMAAAFIAACFFEVNVIWIILAAGAVGLLNYFWKTRKAGRKGASV